MGAVGASAPTVFDSVGVARTVFGKFLKFTSILIKMMWKMLQY